MLSKALRLMLCLPLALLAGCEGSTTMTHTLHNRSEDSLVLKALFDSLPWYDTATVVLPPAAAPDVLQLGRGRAPCARARATPLSLRIRRLD